MPIYDEQSAHDSGSHREPWADDTLPLQVVLGLGDPERERKALFALNEASYFVVVARCLAADQVLAAVRDAQPDVVLLGFDLHRLSQGILGELAQYRIPLVLLTPEPDVEPWRSIPGIALPLDVDADTLRAALQAAARGERRRPAVSDEMDLPDTLQDVAHPSSADGLSIIAVASGHGSPGRTTVALNLAAALGAVASTILVDLDLSGPSLAAYLDADPTHNLYMLAHMEPQSPQEWNYGIELETQPLSPRSPQAVVLCGVPKPEMRTRLTSRFFTRLIEELHSRFRYVILDIGADLLGAELVLHRAAVGVAQQVLLVASADLVGLWHGHTALNLLKSQLKIETEQIVLIINRHDGRYHHGRTEIEWALDVPTAAVIPYDHRGVQRALASQQPLIFMSRSRAARALLDLADRVYGGQIQLPPDPTDTRPRWLRWLPGLRGRRAPRPLLPNDMKGQLNGHESGFNPSQSEPVEQRSNGRAPTPRGNSRRR